MNRWFPPLVVPFLFCACDTFHKPVYPVEERKLLLVPFRDLSVRFGHGYDESDRGKQVVEALRRWAERETVPAFADAQTTEAVVRELREWTKDGISRKDWRGLLRGVDTDLVLVGEIRELKPRDANAVGFFKGRANARYSLIDASTGEEAYRSTEVSVEYPRSTDFGIPLSEFDTKPQDIERGLLRALGEAVAKELYGYYAAER